jgi:catechol 2,3-dioxygenase-like lactoylglutathione lyase family enzyme
MPEYGSNKMTCGKSQIVLRLLVVGTLLSGWRSVPAQAPEENPLQLTLHHATLSVADIDKETEWFVRVLGFKAAEQNKGADFIGRHLEIPGYRIDLSQKNGSARHSQAKGTLEQGWVHVVFQTPAMDAAFKRLTAEHTDVTAARNPQGAITQLIVHDPEGNEIEITPKSPSNAPG